MYHHRCEETNKECALFVFTQHCLVVVIIFVSICMGTYQ